MAAQARRRPAKPSDVFEPFENAGVSRRELVGHTQGALGPLVMLEMRCSQTQAMCEGSPSMRNMDMET